jgi:hypothetical protein
MPLGLCDTVGYIFILASNLAAKFITQSFVSAGIDLTTAMWCSIDLFPQHVLVAFAASTELAWNESYRSMIVFI